ncbi:DJ-1/PfpI family protein [Geomesophilobacter sediminis]|uniref:DJ-1/PfpI family protein n=2 Tax=Geomesophilobacter sediminis TaxID=2798584 RepID=A0A8J7JIX6_9BACT|nr:DJ-1/PfpI family protein [Geomesophilobacter sediminis]MBJ6724395.1 DJ-1/PfpI family protein [Geomesophilobacter sediminis]
MKILMVLTSHDQLGDTGRKTGFWLEEFAAPYYVFKDAGVELTLASPKGGQPPLDPVSDLPENQTPAMTRFKKDQAAQNALANTVKLADQKAEEFDTVFYPGGHGPMWDLAESPVSITLLESFYNSGKPIALVCHSPGVLRHVTYQGAPLVKGKHVTGFTNGEEEQVQLTKVVPFLVENELLGLGAIFEKKANWQPFVITDGRLITGQNPASSTSAAQALLKLMTASEAESTVNAVQIEQKSYEMPPRDGISIAHFLTVTNIERSARYYEKVFGARILSLGDGNAPGYLQLANIWIILNVGGGPTQDKPTVTLSVPDPDRISSFLNFRVADIRACYKLWESRGAEFITEPIRKYGELRCYIRDPDGYLIEVGQSTDLQYG